MTPALDAGAGVSVVVEISDALVVSRLAGVRPSPGSDCVVVFDAAGLRNADGTPKRAHTGPVTPVAIGTSMPSAVAGYRSDRLIALPRDVEHDLAPDEDEAVGADG